MHNFIALVPARMASSRLPNKPLADIGGVPMVVRVAQRASLAGAARVVIATDAAEIQTVARQHDIEVVMTSPDHPSGTDRLAEACALLELAQDAIVVNVQGDEPLIPPSLVASVAQLLADRPDCAIATAAHPIDTLAEYLNPNVVKVVTDASGCATYFSRAPVPWDRDHLVRATPDHLTEMSEAMRATPPLRHIGLYGYRVAFLLTYPRLARSPHETLESLEQLRALWHGYRIAVLRAEQAPPPGVDTLEDLERVRRLV